MSTFLKQKSCNWNTESTNTGTKTAGSYT